MISKQHMSIQKIDRCRFSLLQEICSGAMPQRLQPEASTVDSHGSAHSAQPPHAHGLSGQAIDTKKDFEDISVQEIADEATLNRATFYLHYPDKNALLQAMTGVRFRDLIERRSITFTDCNGALRAIALGVCDYLAETTGCPTQLARIPLERLHHSRRRGHVQGRACPSWNSTRC